jgi:hypothetical protein
MAGEETPREGSIKGNVEFTKEREPVPQSDLGGPNEVFERAVRISGEFGERLLNPRLAVNLQRTDLKPTDDQALWIAIRNRADSIGFRRYREYIDYVLCGDDHRLPSPASPASPAFRPIENMLRSGRNLNAPLGVDAYNRLRMATQAFLLLECGVAIKDRDPDLNLPDPNGPAQEHLYNAAEEAARLDRNLDLKQAQDLLTTYLGAGILPYIKLIVGALGAIHRPGHPGSDPDRSAPYCTKAGYLYRFLDPCLLELIWSYWHEEGMLVQTVSAIALRFQNQRSGGSRDPLAHLEIDPLRPLSNLIWGYIQDEYNRLTVVRRAYEYDHHYGLNLVGRAVPQFRPADSRSRFLEAFHDLILRTARFYQEDADTTVISNAFPLLNGLREVHLILAEGAHNQFGDLPWTARYEMMIQQYILARPEMREFLGGRIMVPYQEEWMGRVDTMKTIQGWTDVSVSHFHFLAIYGEQILLSIRYGNWVNVQNQNSPKNWARYWRPEIEGYLHAYRAATGVDLTSAETADATQPSVLLSQRLAGQLRSSRATRVIDVTPRGQTLPAAPAAPLPSAAPLGRLAPPPGGAPNRREYQ